MEGTGRDDIPFPLDHFFFCFLPAAAAAGACREVLLVFSASHGEDGSHVEEWQAEQRSHTMIADF